MPSSQVSDERLVCRIVSNEQRSPNLVILPDCFISLMAPDAKVSPCYKDAQGEADEWIRDVLQFDKKTYAKYKIADFALIAALFVPGADTKGVKFVHNWMSWVLYFDDMFDEGLFRESPVLAQAEADATMAILSDSHPLVNRQEQPLRYITQSLWYRFRERSSPALQQRYIAGMRDYMNGIVDQVRARVSGQQIDMDTYLSYRIGSSALRATYSMIELTLDLDLPDYVHANSCVKASARAATIITMLQNDIVSYRKEMRTGDGMNAVAIARQNGNLTVQEAMDHVHQQVRDAMRQWHLAQADLPSWGATIDRHVQKYLEGMLDQARGNLTWAFISPRYFGLKADEVRKTRLLDMDEVM